MITIGRAKGAGPVLLSCFGWDRFSIEIFSGAGFPSLLEDICRKLDPHRLTYYLTDLAASFHRYFNLGTKNPELRIVTHDRELSQARLFLAKAINIVIANGLRLLGVSAPERM